MFKILIHFTLLYRHQGLCLLYLLCTFLESFVLKTCLLFLLTGEYLFTQLGVLMQNVALSRTADQSSSHPDGPARNAVDGNRDPNFAKGSCSLTHQESNPWWRVDLQNVYTVTAVMITNRNEFENRLDGAEIWIGNSLEDNGAKKSRCAIISHIPKGRTFYFPCSSTEGRYVTVFLPGTKKILSLCDVQVFPLDYADGTYI
uniref:Fucolectin tachylectin-4 pentraxin-1 domain-containing protein n=1 Tax=Labrus bergylta TaxID=56723 RepID=A0A3Q3EC77_9LABR